MSTMPFAPEVLKSLVERLSSILAAVQADVVHEEFHEDGVRKFRAVTKTDGFFSELKELAVFTDEEWEAIQSDDLGTDGISKIAKFMGPPNPIVFGPFVSKRLSAGQELDALKKIKTELGTKVARLEGMMEALQQPTGHPFGRWVRLFVAKRGYRILDMMMTHVAANISAEEPPPSSPDSNASTHATSVGDNRSDTTDEYTVVNSDDEEYGGDTDGDEEDGDDIDGDEEDD